MSLPCEMQHFADDIKNSFLDRKAENDRLKKEVCELLRLYETERAEMAADLRRELDQFVARLKAEVDRLLRDFAKDRMRCQRELGEAQRVWDQLGVTMERLRRKSH